MRKWILAISSVAALVVTGAASAEDYKVLAPAAPGGGWDQTARTMQSVLQDEKFPAMFRLSMFRAQVALLVSRSSSIKIKAIRVSLLSAAMLWSAQS